MKKIAFFALLIASFAFTSCHTTKEGEFIHIETPPEPPALQTELPIIEFTGNGIKYECENMLLKNFLVLYDKDASGLFATRLLNEAATAQVKIKFPAGTYAGLLNEKAMDSKHSAFYVYVDTEPFRVYPSNPPLGSWELTTRAPIYFTIDEPRTILITIQANSDTRLGHTGMSLDYIQFIKH